ncbi:hypothetical protein JCM18237_28010 [Halorubrum luteum]
MPEIASDTTMASCYPPESLYAGWCEQAEELDMSTSRYIIRMVEAGRKNISMDDVPAESIQELRKRRSELKREVARQRERIDDLEQQLERTSRTDIIGFVEQNPGVTSQEITQRIADTVPGRVASHLDALEGEVLAQRNGGYYIDMPENDKSA